MNKCTCYCTGERTLYNYMGFKTYTEPYGYCNGTRERDECSCGGDLTKCDFYPEVRERVLKEQKPKFGEWISVEDRLPEKDGQYLCFCNYSINGHPGYMHIYDFALNLMKVDKYDFKGQKYAGWYSYDGEWGYCNHTNITHWQPLPELPKGD